MAFRQYGCCPSSSWLSKLAHGASPHTNFMMILRRMASAIEMMMRPSSTLAEAASALRARAACSTCGKECRKIVAVALNSRFVLSKLAINGTSLHGLREASAIAGITTTIASSAIGRNDYFTRMSDKFHFEHPKAAMQIAFLFASQMHVSQASLSHLHEIVIASNHDDIISRAIIFREISRRPSTSLKLLYLLSCALSLAGITETCLNKFKRATWMAIRKSISVSPKANSKTMIIPFYGIYFAASMIVMMMILLLWR